MAITPSWTDAGGAVLVSQSLARAATVRGTVDLRTKFGAYLFARIGRTGTAALSNGVDILLRRTLSAGVIKHPGAYWAALSLSAAAVSTTVGTDSAAGQPTLACVADPGFAIGDFLLIGGGTAREEWGRVSKIVAPNITLDDNLRFAHTAAQADVVINKADCFQPIWMDGGAIWEVIFDYGDDGTGNSVIVEALVQSYDSDVSA